MTICTYCKSRVFPTDRKCPACGSRVFVELETDEAKTAQMEQQATSQAFEQASGPQVVYRTIHQTVYVKPEHSDRNRWVALLLCLVGGTLGLHRFYVGKVGSGIFYLLTGGVFLFGAVADFFCILLGSFRDRQGLPLR